MSVDIASIVLTKSEEKFLRSLKSGKETVAVPPKRLISYGLVVPWSYEMERNRPVNVRYAISDDGRAYLKHLRDKRSDHRWTRWIAILSLAISVLALLLEFQDRGYLPLF